MNEPGHVVVLRRFEGPAERIFAACFDPVWLGRWMLHPEIREDRSRRLTRDARVGGKFSFIVERDGAEVDHHGEYLALDRPRLVALTWTPRDCLPAKSRVIVEITPCDHGCEVKLTHLLGSRWSAHVDRAADAWSRLLDALAHESPPPPAAVSP